MASQTANLGLTLPVGSENVSRQVINDNMTLIDTAYGALNQIKKVSYTMTSSADTVRIDNKGLGVTADNFIRAIIKTSNNITVLPHTYSGYLYVSFYNKSTMATVSGTYTLDIMYYE